MYKHVFVAGLSVQHASVLRPIYNEMVRQGCPCVWGEVKNRDEMTNLYGGIWPWDGDRYVFSCGGDASSSKQWKNAIYHPHGVGDESPVMWDIRQVLTTGPKLQEEYVKNYPQDAFRFSLVGFPKIDVLFRPERKEIEEQLRERLNLKYEKTILFAGFYYYLENYPKWNPILCKILLKLLRIAESNSYNVIIKPHVSTLSVSDVHHNLPEPDTGYTIPRDIFDPKIGSPYTEYREHFSHLKNVNWISPLMADVTHLYLVSDLCIGGDGSSCLFEFMALDKPTIAIQEMDKGFQLNPGLRATDQNLGEAIERCLEKPDEFKNERRKCVEERIYMPDGHASERAVKALLDARF